MKPSDFTEASCTRNYANMLDRVNDSLGFLCIHGFLSQSEKKKARARMEKWLYKDQDEAQKAVSAIKVKEQGEE